MNKLIMVGLVAIAFSLASCGDKTPANKASTTPAPVAPPTSNPIAQPALDATDKAKQVEGIMKKEEATQKQAIDAK